LLYQLSLQIYSLTPHGGQGTENRHTGTLAGPALLKTPSPAKRRRVGGEGPPRPLLGILATTPAADPVGRPSRIGEAADPRSIAMARSAATPSRWCPPGSPISVPAGRHHRPVRPSWRKIRMRTVNWRRTA